MILILLAYAWVAPASHQLSARQPQARVAASMLLRADPQATLTRVWSHGWLSWARLFSLHTHHRDEATAPARRVVDAVPHILCEEAERAPALGEVDAQGGALGDGRVSHADAAAWGLPIHVWVDATASQMVHRSCRLLLCGPSRGGGGGFGF